MSIVSVYINGKEHQLACDDGQEEQLVLLSQEIDDRVTMLARQIPHANESMLLLLVAIMLADELGESKRSMRQLQGEINRLQEMLEQDNHAATADESKLAEMEAAMAETLQEVAGRIEKIAAQLEMG